MFAALSPSCITEDAMLDVLSTTSAISFSCPITATSNDRHDVWNYRSIEFVQQFALADNNEISKVRVTVHLWGESTGDRWFPTQRVSNTENMSIRWRHNVKVTSLHSPGDRVLRCSHPYWEQVQIEKKGKKIKVARRYFIKWKFFFLLRSVVGSVFFINRPGAHN